MSAAGTAPLPAKPTRPPAGQFIDFYVGFQYGRSDALEHLSETRINKITHLNAMKFFNFDPFKHHKREDLTVGALRAKAAADKVDITPRSFGGAKPLAEGEAPRVVTSGDLARMFAHHAKGGSKAA